MAEVSPRDRDAIIRTLIGEAGDQSPEGQAGVVHVIMRRAGDPQFGTTPYQVVHQPNAFEAWQRNGRRLREIRPDSPQYQSAAQVVDGVLSGQIPDPTGGANHFYAPKLQRDLGRSTPAWARGKTPSAVIGGHSFYNMPKDWLNEWDSSPSSAPAIAVPRPASAGRDWLGTWDTAPAGTQITVNTRPRSAVQKALDLIPTDDTSSAAAGGFTRGIPIVGPFLDEGAKHAAAAVRSAMYKTPFQDELKAVNDYANKTAQAHPVAEGLGEFGGGATGLAIGGLAAPAAMGLSGPLLTRIAAGGVSGAGINALDAAIRSGGDPYQTALGGATGLGFGAGGPLVGQAIGAGARKVLGMSNTAQSYLLQRAAQLGIPIRPPQTSSSGFVKGLDYYAGQLPGGGGTQAAAQQSQAVEKAAAKTFGANEFSQNEMFAAKKRLGQSFDDVQKRMMAAHDQPFQDHIQQISDNAALYPAEDIARVDKIISHVTNEFGPDGAMQGETYRALTKKGTPLDKATKDPNPNVRSSAIEIRNALDDSAIRWSDPADSAQLAQTKLAWKNMKTVEPLINRPGGFSPLALQNRVNQSFNNRAYTGAGDLGDIADIAQQFMREPRDSATPKGNVMMTALTHAPKVAGALLGAGSGYEAGETPWGIAQDAVIGLAGSVAAAKTTRAILNNPALVGSTFRDKVFAPSQYAAPAARNALTVDVSPRPGYYDQQ